MSLLSVRGVTRRIGRRAILNDVSLDVDRGEMIAVLGPSGSGKTTLLRVINMLDRPDAGTVLFRGQDIWAGNEEETRRSMVMMFQKPVPFSMSVYDNIAYGMKLRKMSKQEISAAVEEALKLLDMAGKESQYARSLSGGEAQRLAFARAYVLKPDLLLLDEPTANLDPANAGIMERVIRETSRRLGTTVILVTHDMYQARRLASRSAFMLDGELIEMKPTAELFSSPDDPRTARFIKGELIY
ncbi:MAG: Trehalose/maltose import ATP-binding protein MalK [Methanocella sp. PtaU1.Bin125]|nr:MAG: Trehalose/maltose import ATP-binding protein MalK [Methanocella sp. PtaU1.Bin125]